MDNLMTKGCVFYIIFFDIRFCHKDKVGTEKAEGRNSHYGKPRYGNLPISD
jgi:hypothetical protein